MTAEYPITGGCAQIETEHEEVGCKIRTLVTNRHRLTVYSGQEYGELFDLMDDPEETRNLWFDSIHQPLRDELQIKLLHKIMETENSLPRQLGRA